MLSELFPEIGALELPAQTRECCRSSASPPERSLEDEKWSELSGIKPRPLVSNWRGSAAYAKWLAFLEAAQTGKQVASSDQLLGMKEIADLSMFTPATS